MHEVHYSLQEKIVCKPNLEQQRELRKVNAYDKGWYSHFTSVSELVENVVDKGYAWSTTIFRKAERLSSKFVMADMFALDFDNKDKDGRLSDDQITTPDDVLKNHPLVKGICLIYHSSSSTPEWPRFRVVFKVDTPFRDRKSYRLFSYKLHAVSAALFGGLDGCMDEARIWYGTDKGLHYINEQAVVDLEQLDYHWNDLEENIRKQYEFKALKDVVPREVLVSKGLIKEKDEYLGDPEVEAEILKLCLSFIPKWEAEDWYANNCWILGAAVHTVGVELAASIFEEVWGPWPRDHKRDLFEELRQWENDSGSGLNAGLGSVIYAAKQSSRWGEEESKALHKMQREGAERAGFNFKFHDELSLEAVQELFSVYKVDNEDSLKPALGKMNFTERLDAVESGILEIIQDSNKSRHFPKARNLNEMLGTPLTLTEIQRQMKKGYLDLREKTNDGEKPLIGWRAVQKAAASTEKNAGYLCKYVVPKGSCTLVGGPPKVGKTSNLLTLLINSFVNGKAGKGIPGNTFSHLTIYSDDQKASFTAQMINTAVNSLELEDESTLDNLDLNIYPSLKLDDDGIERLAQKAKATPGGCFIIDSLMSTAGKLGISENDAQIANVIYDAREAIEMVDPSATILIIHHLGKNGTNGKSQVDSMRGSTSIPGATDNILSIEKPSTKKNGNDVADDLTCDRVFHLQGRSIPETKVVLRGTFTTKTLVAEGSGFDVTEVPYSSKLEYLCDYVDYDKHKNGDAITDGIQEAVDNLAGQTRDIYLAIRKYPGGIQQSHIAREFNKSTVSKAVAKLSAMSPRLVRVERDEQYTILYPEGVPAF